MDLECLLGNVACDWSFFSSLLGIVVINIILSGDNAVLIALAVRGLPKAQRRQGIIFGTGAAIVLRIVLTFFVSQLLQIHYLKLIGGSLILWIAIKLLMEGAPDESGGEAKSLMQALKILLIADLTMSLDNVLAVAAASHGSMALLIFGLGSSIPIVVLASNLLASFMDKYPVIIYIGAAILGKVGGQMIITDPAVANLIDPVKVMPYAVEGFFAVAVIAAGTLWMKWTSTKENAAQAGNVVAMNNLERN